MNDPPMGPATGQSTTAVLRAYLRSVADTRSTGHATEHSYRPALKMLGVKAVKYGSVFRFNQTNLLFCGRISPRQALRVCSATQVILTPTPRSQLSYKGQTLALHTTIFGSGHGGFG